MAPSGTGLDDVFAAVYEELKRVAHRHLRGERTGHTLGTTALVHEAYIELAKLEHVSWPGRPYMLAAASKAMRRILIDYAEARRAEKRGGAAVRIALEPSMAAVEERGDDLLALDEALHRLERLNARQSRIVECRFFAGMSVEETAAALELSAATVKRDWVAARGWLNREVQS